MEHSDEKKAQDALYGPETRSGHVTQPLEVVYAVSSPFAGFIAVEMWCDWDSISWEDPRHSIKAT